MKTAAKYLAFARIAAVHATSNRAEVYAWMAFLGVVLGVFSALWRAVAEAGMPVATEPSRLVWYLAATEWILMSAAPMHVEIEGEIRRGEVAYHLTRPFSYLAALAAQGLGTIVVRAPIFALTAFAGAFAFTGRIPDARGFLYVVPFGLCAMTLVEGLYVLTGLAAFWIGDVLPLFWVWQKLLFTLGGLMLPISLYPGWLQRVADWTPFPWLLAHPAGFLTGAGSVDPWTLAWHLGAWSAAIAIAARAMFSRAMRTLQVNGG